MLGLVEVAVFYPNLQQDFAAGFQCVFLFLANQVAGYQRKQIRRFLERVFPFGVVAAIGEVALFDQIAVRQQHRIFLLVGAQHDGVFGHHIGTVREIGNLAEAFSFALGEEIAVGHIQTHQRRIFFRTGQRFNFQHALGRRRCDAQFSGFQLVLARFQLLAVEAQLHQFQLFAEQDDFLAAAGRIAAHRDAGGDTGRCGVEVEAHVDGVDQEGWNGVILTKDGEWCSGSICAHGK